MIATCESGSIVRPRECAELARRAEGREIAARVLARVRAFDVERERCDVGAHDWARERANDAGEDEVTIEVDLSAIRSDADSAFDDAQVYRRGALVIIIGDARLRPADGKCVMLARVARAVDGLDVEAYDKALNVRRRFLGETPISIARD